jgi:DNA-binding protein HU-beta
MNKKELIDALADQTSLTKGQAEAAINALASIITSSLSRRQEVSIYGVGTFCAKSVEERQGRNPSTGEAITVAAHVKPLFKASKTLKDAINAQA